MADVQTISDFVRVSRGPKEFGLKLHDSQLGIESVRLAEIAEKVGTPTYVYGSEHISERYLQIDQVLSGIRHQICYALKANESHAILRHLARMGCGADIVSGGELMRATAANIEPHRIVYSGVGKSEEEIDAALAAKIRSFNVESGQELERIARRAESLGTIAPVSIRVNPDVDPKTHPYVATGQRDSKFGVMISQCTKLIQRAIQHPSLSFVGLAFHIGSQLGDFSAVYDSLDRVGRFIEELRGQGIVPRDLDVGGGFWIRYNGSEPEIDLNEWGRAVGQIAQRFDLEVLTEPGRFIVGNSGVLLTRVIGHKESENRRFVIVDAAMNDFLRPALYGSYHAVCPTMLPAKDASCETVDIVGPICECSDFIAQQRLMPKSQPGDLLAVLSAGAYGMVMSSHYNSRPAAAEVLVSGDRWAVTRKRQSVEELLAQEILPEWLK